jgi:hypothetical protein
MLIDFICYACYLLTCCRTCQQEYWSDVRYRVELLHTGTLRGVWREKAADPVTEDRDREA